MVENTRATEGKDKREDILRIGLLKGQKVIQSIIWPFTETLRDFQLRCFNVILCF